MDANGTRFHLLLGERDWATCRDGSDPRVSLAAHFRRKTATCGSAADTGGFAWDDGRAELTLRPCVVSFEAARNDTPPDPTGADRRGAARDRFGNSYWIATSSTEIRVLPSGTGAGTHFWAATDDLPCEERSSGAFRPAVQASTPADMKLAGLAVTDDHYLVAGVIEPAGLLVFDLHAAGPPQQLVWPADTPDPFVPFDLATRPGGGVWILDRVGRRYWALDRHLTVATLGHPMDEIDPARRDDFQPLAAGPARRTPPRQFPAGIAIDAVDPVAIEGLPDGSVLILDRGAGRSRLLRDGADGRYGAPVALRPFDVDGYDFAFVAAAGGGASPAGRLFVASAEGNQVFAHDLAPAEGGGLGVSMSTTYLPMRLFGGKAIIADATHAYYDFFDGWVPVVAQRRPRYAASATLQTRVFDGREPGCVWHRLMLDACIPPDARVAIRSRAADEEGALAVARWRAEPSPYLRRDGSELARPQAAPPAGHDGTWELLFQEAKGRYLQVELTLGGNERVTPRVRALRAYYPRFSYLERYLPAVYRDEPASASFLDRFLANIEGTFTTLEDRIAAVQMLMDVQSAPAGALDWLASWFGIALDPAWTETRRRLFLRHAMDFFRMRGTVRGLQAAVRLAIDDCVDASVFAGRSQRLRPDQVRIVEAWRTRRLPPVVAGDASELEGPRVVTLAARWRPAQSASVLHERYRAWMTSHGIAVAAGTEMPLTAPADAAAAREWRAFAAAVLGFVPSATVADAGAWQAFLQRRYPSASSLAAAYGTASARDVPLLTRLPADGPLLADWYDFQARVLAMRRGAHRFSVLLPAPRGGDAEASRRRRLDLVRRVVELEKPAHTLFDVKFYWALFRIGQARLGEDTLVDRGGRAPDLLPALRLGETYVGESHLSPGHPQDAIERQVLDRDRLAARPRHEETGA